MKFFMRNIPVNLSLIAIVIAASGVARSAAASDYLVRISTGSMSGVYYHIGVDLCREINKRRHDHGLWCSVEASKGSEENLKRLASGSNEFVISQSDVLEDFYQGGGEADIVAVLYQEMLHAFIPPDSDIQGYDDIIGRRVNVGEVGSGTRAVVDKLLSHLGFDAANFSIVKELDPASQVSDFCAGRIDVSFWMAAVPNPLGDEITTSCSANLLSLDVDDAPELFQAYKLSLGEITREDYATIDRSVLTPQVSALLVSGPAIPEAIRSRFHDALSEAQHIVRRNSRFLREFELR